MSMKRAFHLLVSRAGDACRLLCLLAVPMLAVQTARADNNGTSTYNHKDGRIFLIADRSAVSDTLDKGGVPEAMPKGFQNVGDLDNDGVPELLNTVEEYSRDEGSIRRTIYAWNAAGKEYRATRLVAVTRSSGSCGRDNLVENMSFDASAKPFPAVLLTRKSWKTDEKCAEQVLFDSTDRYQWNPVFKDYVTLLRDLGEGEQAALRRASVPAEELPVQQVVFAQGGAVKELSKSFDLKTVVTGFEKKGGFVYFRAEDNEWRSDYAWRPLDGTLQFMAQSRKTGKTVYSKPHEANVFKKRSE